MDAARQRRGRGRPATSPTRGCAVGERDADRRGGAGRAGVRRGRRGARHAAGLGARRAPLRGPDLRAASDGEPGGRAGARRRLRHDRGRHRHRPHRAGVRRGRLPRSASRTSCSTRPTRTRCYNPVRPTAPTTSASSATTGRSVVDPAARRRPDRRAARARAAAARGGSRALLPALLALRHAAALLREAVLVHRDLAAARSAARRQRDGQLASAAHQARPLRRLAGGQRRLGALARALLGHAAADLALRPRRPAIASASAPSPSSSGAPA